MHGNVKVMMTTEGTYPFHHGGVSTWCDTLVNNLNKQVDYVLYSVIMNPFVTQKFNLPSNSKLIKVPLWGTEEPSEHLNIPFSKVYLAKKRTTDEVIEKDFLPLFKEMIREVINYNKDPEHFGKVLHKLYKYFQKYEYKESFKSKKTWNAYKELVVDFTTNTNNNMPAPGVYSIIQSLGWLYRFMTILNTPIPEIDVTHSAAAAFCGIPCVLAKLEHNAPYILTEHGVYLREQYLSLSKRGYPSFLNTFLIRLIHSIVNLNYYYADQVSPVCEYNTRWEERFGVNYERIKVIYNGVDTKVFSPKLNINKSKVPTVVSVARIDPVKDIITLLRAAAKVKSSIPEVKFIIYGSVSVQEYYEECKKIKEELQLGDTFIFAGHTNDVPKAYHSGDIVVLSSISEAFPYSVVEAMMSGKAVVATDVGGVKEALGDTGIVVTPRDEEELADGIITLLNNTELRLALSEEARERALSYFTIDKAQNKYYESYVNLAIEKDKATYVNKNITEIKQRTAKKQQKLFMERGYALIEQGFYVEAIKQFRLAIKQSTNSTAVPVMLTKIADAYNALGQYEEAKNEIERAEVLIKALKLSDTA